MKRTSQTHLAVLGALSVEPMSGYAVRQAIREILGHFWSESFGQIYPALAELEANGLVRRQAQGRTSGSVFEITAAGLEELRGLLAQPFENPPARNGLLLRLFFGRHLGDDACRELLLAARDDAERRVAEYAAIRAEIDAEGGPDRKYFAIAVMAGEHNAAATIAWVDEALAALDS